MASTEHIMRVGRGPQHFIAEVQPPLEDTNALNDCPNCIVAKHCINNETNFGSHAYVFDRRSFGWSERDRDVQFLEYIRERAAVIGNISLEDSLVYLEEEQKSLFEPRQVAV
jgi:hypothetical protein